MSIFLILIHVFVCIALIMIVLLQTGKGADMGAAFGGGSSQTLFGSTGASTFLSKATTAAAVIFMLTSLGTVVHGEGQPYIFKEAGSIPFREASHGSLDVLRLDHSVLVALLPDTNASCWLKPTPFREHFKPVRTMELAYQSIPVNRTLAQPGLRLRSYY